MIDKILSAVNKLNLFLFFFIRLPSTFLHELSHALVAFLLGSKILGFSLIPERYGNRYMLGSVKVAARFKVFYFFIGIAPLLLNVLAFWILCGTEVIQLGESVFDVSVNIKNINWPTMLAVMYLIQGGIPSSVDIKVAFSSLFSISGFLLIALCFFIYSLIQI